jgi:hypothetical protein
MFFQKDGAAPVFTTITSTCTINDDPPPLLLTSIYIPRSQCQDAFSPVVYPA